MEVIRVADAPIGGSDPTRRFAVRCDGRVLMPGLTRPEAVAACGWLGALASADRVMALAEVTLPVVLTDGAGPHLLDGDGRLVLVLAPHPALPEAFLAMGASATGYRVGVVRAVGGTGWAWLARADTAAADRVAVLDDLDAVADAHALRAWAGRWAGAVTSLAG